MLRPSGPADARTCQLTLSWRLRNARAKEVLQRRELGRAGRRQAVPLAALHARVRQAGLPWDGHADLGADRGGDPSLAFQLLPGRVVLLRSDQREDVVFTAFLPDERRREAETASRLDLGGGAEDGGGEQVDLVVDDQAPVSAHEQAQVWEVVRATFRARRHDLVGGQRDQADLLVVAAILADVRGIDGRLVEQLPLPLPHRGDAGAEDQDVTRRPRHDAQPDDRLACATGQDQHAAPTSRAASRPESLDGRPLVVAQSERAVVVEPLEEDDRQRRAVGVACQVLNRQANLEQHLLEVASFTRRHQGAGTRR